MKEEKYEWTESRSGSFNKSDHSLRQDALRGTESSVLWWEGAGDRGDTRMRLRTHLTAWPRAVSDEGGKSHGQKQQIRKAGAEAPRRWKVSKTENSSDRINCSGGVEASRAV